MTLVEYSMSDLGPIRFVTRNKCHLARLPAGSRRFRHAHHIIALHRIEGGEAGMGDERVLVTGPFLALLPAGDADINDMYGRDEAWWCAFDGDQVRPAAGGAQVVCAGISAILPRAHFLGGLHARQAETLFLELQAAIAADGLGGRLNALARLADLLALWVATGSAPADDAVDRFRAMLEASAYDAGCSLEALARRHGRHPDALGAAFRRRFGCTPVAFRTQVRLQRARDLLAAGDLDLAGIADACGFPDRGYFCRVFRRHVGITPGDWKRNFGRIPEGQLDAR